MSLYQDWLNAKVPERREMAKKYGITLKGQTHVVGDRIVEDGYDQKEVVDKLLAAEIIPEVLPEKSKRGKAKK